MTKMKKMKKYMCAAMALMMLTGCGDFLEPDSQSEFVPKDASSFNELLLGEAYPRYDKSNLNIFLDLMSDDVTAAPFQVPHEGFTADKYLAAYTWQPDMYEMMDEAGLAYSRSDMYMTHYEFIMGCNAVLDYVDDAPATQKEEINYVKAQAYTLRAFMYFRLVNIFGKPYNVAPESPGVPLKLTSGIEDDEDALKRNTVGEVYAQVLEDLLMAEELYKELPSEKQWKADYRTSLPMVQLLLSRVYLYMENWEKAAAYAKAVMEDSRFKLLDLNTIPTTKFDEEQYITVQYYHDYNSYAESPETIWPYGNPADMAGWGRDYPERDQNQNTIHAYFRASDELINSFKEGDLRKERYIVHRRTQDYPTAGQNDMMPLTYGKMRVSTTTMKPISAQITFGRSLRLSEAYLNYAEAEAMLYQKNGDNVAGTNALDAINTLRIKRFDPNEYTALTADNADDLVEKVREERRRELCFEEHRWYDLRRWGMKEIKHVWYPSSDKLIEYTLNANDLLYTVPLPKNSLDKNAKLEQNELPAKRVGEYKDIVIPDDEIEQQ